MSKPAKICPVNGCKVEIRNNLLMCQAHWNMCAKPLRSTVWRYYKFGSSTMYLEATKAAIEDVNQKERDAATTGVQGQLL